MICYLFNRNCFLIIAFCFVSSATKKWDLPLEFSVNHGNYQLLGKIELLLQHDGNYTGHFKPSSSLNVDEIFMSLINSGSNALYSVRSGDIFSSNKACLMSLAKLQHEFALTINSFSQKLMSLTIYPADVYDTGEEECSQELAKDFKPLNINGRVVVTNLRQLPSPDITTYLQRIEEEKRARQHGASQDNRSFLAKYWMYLVPLVLFIVLSNAASADQQGQE